MEIKIIMLIIMVLAVSGCCDMLEPKPPLKYTILVEKGVCLMGNYTTQELFACNYWNEEGALVITSNITNCEQAIEKYGVRIC